MAEISLMSRRIMEKKAVLMKFKGISNELGVSFSTLRRWIESGYFPKPDYLYGREHRWSSDTVTAWITDQRC